MRRVIIESPYHGDVVGNSMYLTECLRDSLIRGEAPFASHGIYPGALDDEKPHERKQGIHAGYAWWDAADAIVFYVDRGWSAGMTAAFTRAQEEGRTVETRTLMGGVAIR